MEENIFDSWICNRCIAHRGLHNENLPENSLGAFENAIKNNYPIELDVRIIADGTLVVFHDEDLKRVCGLDRYSNTLTKHDLPNCKLLNTSYVIPTFDEVLNLVNGQVPLLIEIKQNGKINELESKLYEKLKDYKGEFAIESFNPFSLEWFKINAPHIMRGQLSSFFKGVKLSYAKKYFLKHLKIEKISKPHFIAYDIDNLPNRYVRKYKHLPLLAWTVKSQQQYIKAVQVSDNVIFEGFEPKI